MDNRKIYKKQSINKRRLNLLGKVKGLVTSIWGSNPSGEDESVQQPGSSNANVSGSTPSTPANQSRVTNMEENEDLKTPNVLLSEFFQQKGDKPLTPVEYQGVMSLLSQSQKKPNNGVMSPLMPGSFTRFDSPMKSPSRNIHSLVKATPAGKTPFKSVGVDAVKSNPSVFTTPEYKPLYPAISANNSIRKSGSVKRVYQFSGLPSPYKTKIKAPALGSAKRHHTSLELTMERSTRDSSKSMTKAASTLLSVLDDTKKNSDYLQQFSNPYMGKSIAKKSQTMTADVINSTIMFDQSTELPDTASNNSSVTTPAGDTASAANTETKTDPVAKPVFAASKLAENKDPQPKIFGFSDSAVTASEQSTSSETTNGSANGVAKPTETFASKTTFSFNAPATQSKPQTPVTSTGSSSTLPTGSTTTLFKLPAKEPTFSFGTTPAAAPSQPAPSTKQAAFSFGTTTSAPVSAVPASTPTDTQNPVVAPIVPAKESAPTSANNDDSFKFPTVSVRKVAIDNSKVQLYKSLFTFSV